MSWPEGIPTIKALLAEGRLEKVTPNLDGANAFMSAAERHLTSARTLAASDSDMAYSALYDASRKALAALLLTQGLRPTTRGGHTAVEEAVRAQFTKGPPRDAFRPFGRLRQTRHQSEYDHLGSVNEDDVLADLALAEHLHEVAATLLPGAPVFTD